jgi:hypothetical protein
MTLLIALALAQETDRTPVDGLLAVTEAAGVRVEARRIDGLPTLVLPQEQGRVLGLGDRPLLAPDGSELVFVRGPIAAIWHLDLASGVETQLTSLEAGSPPPDFVAVPVRAFTAWDGEVLRWTAEDGDHVLATP